MHLVSKFWTSESGAITVDWVVLTGAIVGLGLAVMSVVADGLNSASNNTANQLASLDVGFSFAEAWSSGWGDNPLVNTSGFTMSVYENWTAGYSNDELVEVYEAYHAGHHHTMYEAGDRVDSIGALEYEMNSRGMDIPSGYPSYDDMYADFTG